MNETTTTVYTKEYFIEKLSAIPDENWIGDGDLNDKNNPKKGCLLHHLGVKDDFKATEEALAMVQLIDANLPKLAKEIELCAKIEKNYDKLIDGDREKLSLVYAINDMAYHFKTTPKQSILTCLELM